MQSTEDVLQAMKLDEDAELAASGARGGDVALRMPPAPGPTNPNPHTLTPADDRPPDPGASSLSPDVGGGTNPNYNPSGPHPSHGLASSGPPGFGGRSSQGGAGRQALAGGAVRPGMAASMPAAVAGGGAGGGALAGGERRHAAMSADTPGTSKTFTRSQ